MTDLSHINPQLHPFVVPVAHLKLDPANARRHDDVNLAAIRASLRSFGQQKPIIADSSGVVRVGNGTLTAAIAEGWTLIACIVSNLTGDALRAFAVADNRTAELAVWDLVELTSTMESLAASGFDAACTGFLPGELDALRTADYAALEVGNPLGLKAAPESIDHVREGEVPAKEEIAVSRRGDVWILGRHRVMCGDATDGGDLTRLFNAGEEGEKGKQVADLLLTDPPYGVEYVGKTKKALTIKNDGAAGLRQLLSHSMATAVDRLKPGGVLYIAAPAGPQFLDFAVVLTELECWRQTLVWVKDSMVLGRSDYHYRHEVIFEGDKPVPVVPDAPRSTEVHTVSGGVGVPPDSDGGSQPLVYGWKPGAAHREPVGRRHTTVLQFARPKASRLHPTMKPVDLWAYLMTNSTGQGELVLDTFLGSGTTLVVAEQVGRTCYGMELDPLYVDVVVRRYQKLTGIEAKRYGSGTLFSQAEARLRE